MSEVRGSNLVLVPPLNEILKLFARNTKKRKRRARLLISLPWTILQCAPYMYHQAMGKDLALAYSWSRAHTRNADFKNWATVARPHVLGIEMIWSQTSVVQIVAMYCHGHFSPKVAKHLHITSKNTKKNTKKAWGSEIHIDVIVDNPLRCLWECGFFVWSS